MSSMRYALAALLGAQLAAATSYDLAKDYSGSGFFDDWNFYDNFDNLTNGDATFIGADSSLKLAYVDSNNRAIMKVDNSSTVPYNEKRSTVRIASKDSYEVGNLWVADMYHVPYGCSVWPAFWSQAPGWPTGGEIDTFEGVNMVTMNQMALHTTEGCTQKSPTQSSKLINSTNCDFEADSNAGCVVTDPSTSSYGEGFAKANGGVFITEFAKSGISIWFFPRDSIPDSVNSDAKSINTDDLGTPVANWPTGGCDIDTFFQAQHLIFDITLCGDFAGASNVFSETCSGTCYTDYVMGDGSNYGNAYFEVDYVRVYGSGSSEDSARSVVDSPTSKLLSMASAVGGALVAAWAAL